MHVRFRIPRRLEITGDGNESLPEIRFDHRFSGKVYSCVLEPLASWSKAQDTETEQRQGNVSIRITLSSDPARDLLSMVEAPPPRKELGELLMEIANRSVRALRYRGFVPDLPEITPSPYYEASFQRFNVETSPDRLEWTPLRSDSASVEILSETFMRSPVLRLKRWQSVEAALTAGQDLPYPPQWEFTVNAIEHLYNKNYRFAILEAVIGLELFLALVLDTYLFFRTLMPEAYRKTLLSANLTLELRLKGLLYIVLEDEEIHQLDMPKILKVVSWRNGLVHGQKGKWIASLPQELTDLPEPDRFNKLKEQLDEVWKLIGALERLELTLGAANSRAKKVTELPPHN